MGPIHINVNHIKFQWLSVAFALSFLLIPDFAFSAPVTQNPVPEKDRWFQVELIVFAHNSSDALDSEDWPEISGTSLPDNLVELTFPPPIPDSTINDKPVESSPGLVFEPVKASSATSTPPSQGRLTAEPATPPVAFEMLPSEELLLKDEEKRLSRSSQFSPLLHIAWRQPTYDKEHAQTVLLYEGMDDPVLENSEVTVTNPAQAETLPALNSGSEKSETEVSPSTGNDDVMASPINPRVVGTIRVSVARYLHFEADLIYRTMVRERVAVPLSDLELWDDKPYPTLSERQGPAFQMENRYVMHGFRLEESRRMRSRKVHYLDHPFFGIVVLITPVDLANDLEEEPATDLIQDTPPQD